MSPSAIRAIGLNAPPAPKRPTRRLHSIESGETIRLCTCCGQWKPINRFPFKKAVHCMDHGKMRERPAHISPQCRDCLNHGAHHARPQREGRQMKSDPSEILLTRQGWVIHVLTAAGPKGLTPADLRKKAREHYSEHEVSPWKGIDNRVLVHAMRRILHSMEESGQIESSDSGYTYRVPRQPIPAVSADTTYDLTDDQLQTLAAHHPLTIEDVEFRVSSPAAHKCLLSAQEFADLKAGKCSVSCAGVTITRKPAFAERDSFTYALLDLLEVTIQKGESQWHLLDRIKALRKLAYERTAGPKP